MSEDLILFCVGIIEMFWGTVDFKLTQKTRPILASISTGIKVLIWWSMLKNIITNLNDKYLISIYIAGCMIGTFLALTLSPTMDKFLNKFLKIKKEKKNKQTIVTMEKKKK